VSVKFPHLNKIDRFVHNERLSSWVYLYCKLTFNLINYQYVFSILRCQIDESLSTWTKLSSQLRITLPKLVSHYKAYFLLHKKCNTLQSQNELQDSALELFDLITELMDCLYQLERNFSQITSGQIAFIRVRSNEVSRKN